MVDKYQELYMKSTIDYIPYTYRIKCIPTGKYYYGVRYAEDCNPSDLWVKYFTSSKEIHGLIKLYGKHAFSYEIRRIFTNAEDAISWEIKVNSRTIRFSNYLNKNDGHRFSIESSILGGINCAEKFKGAKMWNNGTKTVRSHDCLGDGWILGIIRNPVRSDELPVRIKGVKLHWWNNGIQNKLSKDSPGHDWHQGMISIVRHWWTNGIDQVMQSNCPGDGWILGMSEIAKDNFSELAYIRSGNEPAPRKIRNKRPYAPVKGGRKMPWWNDGEVEFRGMEPPLSTFVRGRLINTFDNNRESLWWSDGTRSVRTHEDLSSSGWHRGRK